MKFEDVKNVKGHCLIEELEFLMEMVGKIPEEHKDKNLIEVGTHRGKSACTTLLGMQKYNITGTLCLCDTFKYGCQTGSGAGEERPYKESFTLRDMKFGADFLDETKVNIKKFCGDKKVVFFQGYSDDVPTVTIGKTSFIFIDGDHCTHGCLLDILKYSQVLVKGGIIVLHDYPNKEVTDAMNIFRSIRPEYKKLGEKMGMGAFVKG